VQKAKAKQIKILSFNVLNLYDTEHDEGYFDFTFLPKSNSKKSEACSTIRSRYYKNLCHKLNWNPKRLNKKIGQISKVLTHHGSLPDILALQEVENHNVVGRLAKKLGYEEFLVTDQKSKRGIDVALLWNSGKLIYVDHVEVPAPIRDPLRVEFEIKATGESLFVYVNHWAAQSAPTAMRIGAADAVYEDLKGVLREMPQAKIVVTGDFNTTPQEAKSVFGKHFTSNRLKYRLYDLHDESKEAFPELHEKIPEGTFYRGKNTWNRFDRIFVNENLMSGSTQANLESYRIVASRLITGEERYRSSAKAKWQVIRHPLSYNFLEEKGKPLGFSDHLPVSALLEL